MGGAEMYLARRFASLVWPKYRITRATSGLCTFRVPPEEGVCLASSASCITRALPYLPDSTDSQKSTKQFI